MLNVYVPDVLALISRAVITIAIFPLLCGAVLFWPLRSYSKILVIHQLSATS